MGFFSWIKKKAAQVKSFVTKSYKTVASFVTKKYNEAVSFRDHCVQLVQRD